MLLASSTREFALGWPRRVLGGGDCPCRSGCLNKAAAGSLSPLPLPASCASNECPCCSPSCCLIVSRLTLAVVVRPAALSPPSPSPFSPAVASQADRGVLLGLHGRGTHRRCSRVGSFRHGRLAPGHEPHSHQHAAGRLGQAPQAQAFRQRPRIAGSAVHFVPALDMIPGRAFCLSREDLDRSPDCLFRLGLRLSAVRRGAAQRRACVCSAPAYGQTTT